MNNLISHGKLDILLADVWELYLLLCDDSKFKGRKKLQIVESYDILGLEANENKFPIADNEEDGSIELLISKKVFISLFVNCRKYINDYSDSNKLDDLAQLYIASLGILLVTPEDQQNILRHIDVKKELYKSFDQKSIDLIENELFTYLRALLSSSIAKTNKSSTLWTYFRRLSASNGFADTSYVTSCIETSFDSFTYHPRNYYAWNYLRWLSAQLINYGKPYLVKQLILNRVETYCFSNIGDATAWKFSCDILSYDVNQLSFYIEPKDMKPGKGKLFTPIEILMRIRKYTKWVFDSKTASYAPWNAIILLIVALMKSPVMKSIHDDLEYIIEAQVHLKFLEFERKENAIIIVSPGIVDLVYLNELGIADESSKRIDILAKESEDVLFSSNVMIFANLKKSYVEYKKYYR